jgi:hypothetical protein
MNRFTREVRQRIVEDHARRHGGVFDAAVFLEEVQVKGPAHLAFAWFEWADATAAHQHRLEQARDFVRDLKVVFRIEEISRSGTITVSYSAPLVLSPMAERRGGGGYVIADFNDPRHMALLCEEGAATLRSWLRRYEVCLPHVSMPRKSVERLVEVLEEAGRRSEEAA